MLALAEMLPPITERQRQWAFGHCFKPLAVVYPRKLSVRCLCCGQTLVYDKIYIDSFRRENLYDCPYCGRSMAVTNAKEAPWNDCKHFTVLTTFRGHQVARTWEVCRSNNLRENFSRLEANEIFQIWITDDGHETITGRHLYRSLNSMKWDFHKPLDIRRHNNGGTGYIQWDDAYDIAGNFLYPEVRVTPLLRRNGWTNKLLCYQNMIALTDAWRYLLSVPTSEMLVKTGQLDLFLHMARSGLKQIPFLHSVRIANRNGYIVRDAQMWLDMLQMADELGRDTHNPKVVCPSDLRIAHDTLLTTVTRLRERLNRDKKIREAPEWESHYLKKKAPYLGIAFSRDGIVVSVLQSVAEFVEEGKTMQHCVFASGYYKKPDSLILSARDSDGNRLETIEVNLRLMSVEQSRAKYNGRSPRHQEIVQLVKDYMFLIREAKAKKNLADKSKNTKLCQTV